MIQGAVLESMPRLQPGITILAAPRVVTEKDAAGREVQRIERYAVRASVAASPSTEHPGPFHVGWELRPMDQEPKRVAHEGGGTETRRRRPARRAPRPRP